jgi:Uma2 family endonuclease
MTMTAVIPTDHHLPWTEEEYLALGETEDRVELFEGDLHVSSSPTPRHQRICGKLYTSLDAPSEACGLHVHTAVNLRLKPGTIVIPDLTITSAIDFDARVVSADRAKLVCEVTSPSNATTDKVLKMHYYAEAGIPWYLLVEHETATLRLHRLENSAYILHATVRPGDVLRLVEPVRAEIRPESLLPPR